MSFMTEEKIRMLRLIARGDEEYRDLLEDYNELEKKFTGIIRKLPQAEQDTVWEFVCTSDAVDHRLLEIICEGIRPAKL